MSGRDVSSFCIFDRLRFDAISRPYAQEGWEPIPQKTLCCLKIPFRCAMCFVGRRMRSLASPAIRRGVLLWDLNPIPSCLWRVTNIGVLMAGLNKEDISYFWSSGLLYTLHEKSRFDGVLRYISSEVVSNFCGDFADPWRKSWKKMFYSGIRTWNIDDCDKEILYLIDYGLLSLLWLSWHPKYFRIRLSEVGVYL